MKMCNFILILLFILFNNAVGKNEGGTTIDWQVLSGGGIKGLSESYFIDGTVSQTAVGLANSENILVHHGYWQDFQHSICGDANGDENVNISDAVYIINYVFIGGNPPDPYESGDANCDGSVNVSDAVWIINYVFIGGNDPCDINGDDIPDC